MLTCNTNGAYISIHSGRGYHLAYIGGKQKKEGRACSSTSVVMLSARRAAPNGLNWDTPPTRTSAAHPRASLILAVIVILSLWSPVPLGLYRQTKKNEIRTYIV